MPIPFLSFAPEILRDGARQLVYTTIVFLVVWALLRILPRTSPALRHALWGLVLLRLILPPDLAAPWGLRNLVSVSSHGETPLTLPFEEPMLTAVNIAAPMEPPPPRREGKTSPLAAFWFVGAGFTLFLLARRRRAYARKMEEPIDDPRILRKLERWRTRLGIRRPVRLFTGGAAVSPFTFGSLRPRIFIPRPLLATDRAATLDVVLAHELVHVRRLDDAVLLAERLLASVYFFFPPARVATSRRAVEREALCDQAVLANGVSRRAYARALLDVVQLNLGGDVAVATFIQPRSTFSMRLKTVLAESKAHTPRRLPATAAALLLGALLLPMATVPTSLAADDPPTPSPANESPALPTPGLEQEPKFVLLHPLPQARLTAGFGPWKHPVRKEKVHHDGIDLAIGEGHEIVAPMAGTVSRARPAAEDDNGYGTILEITHDHGITTHYYHLGELRAEVGQRVEQGQVIATVGMTGQTTGPHLHFEVRVDGELVDPEKMFDC